MGARRRPSVSHLLMLNHRQCRNCTPAFSPVYFRALFNKQPNDLSIWLLSFSDEQRDLAVVFKLFSQSELII